MRSEAPDPRSAEPLLEVSGVSQRYPNGTLALDNVTLSARPGELTVILGHNGSGKSTLVRCIVRLLDPTSGSIKVAGEELTGISGARLRRARRRIAVIFQGASLVPRRSALSNVACGSLGREDGFLSQVGSFPAAELAAARRSLERVGLGHLAAQRSDTLSGGQAQRVAVARALHQSPAVLLADEPVSSLDPDAADEVMELLSQLAREEGLAVVAVLHQLDLARRYAQRIVGMRQGRVAFDLEASTVEMDALASLYRAEAS